MGCGPRKRPWFPWCSLRAVDGLPDPEIFYGSEEVLPSWDTREPHFRSQYIPFYCPPSPVRVSAILLGPGQVLSLIGGLRPHPGAHLSPEHRQGTVHGLPRSELE